MDLKEKKKVKIVLCGLIIIIVIIALFVLYGNKKEDSDSVVSYKTVEKLYEDNVNNCTEIVKINKDMEVSEVNDDILLYLIFGQMKKDDILGSKISIDDYNKSALKILNEEDIPTSFEYVYDGYKYSSNGNNITRSKATCEENYVSKLYGYSGTDHLEVDVMAGYIKDGKVYDLNDKELGDYSEKTLNKILDSGTMQVYNYEKVGNDYKLVSVGVK